MVITAPSCLPIRYPHSLDVIFDWVSTYGYIAIFSLLVLGIVGLPVPDETLLVFCGYLICRGKLNPFGVFLAAVGGSMCGISVSYTIGRTLGWKVLHSRFGRFLHITEAEIRRVHDWFARIGHWALLVGYYIPGFRHFSAIVAGSSHLELRSFALFAYSGAILWVSTFLFIGYHFCDRWQQVLDAIEHHLKIFWCVAAVIAAAWLFVFWLRHRRAKTALR